MNNNLSININKERHILLTVYLFLTIIASIYVLINDVISSSSESNFARAFMIIVGIIDIYFTVMLLKWKKWAFYGLFVTSIIVMVYNLVHDYGILISIVGFSGFVIIYLLLLLKRNGKSGWKNLD